MVKKAKKRGVKPATKRRKYKTLKVTAAVGKGPKIGDFVRIKLPSDFKVSENQVGPADFPYSKPLALCGQLEDAISRMETRISNAITKINSLM